MTLFIHLATVVLLVVPVINSHSVPIEELVSPSEIASICVDHNTNTSLVEHCNRNKKYKWLDWRCTVGETCCSMYEDLHCFQRSSHQFCPSMHLELVTLNLTRAGHFVARTFCRDIPMDGWQAPCDRITLNGSLSIGHRRMHKSNKQQLGEPVRDECDKLADKCIAAEKHAQSVYELEPKKREDCCPCFRARQCVATQFDTETCKNSHSQEETAMLSKLKDYIDLCTEQYNISMTSAVCGGALSTAKQPNMWIMALMVVSVLVGTRY